MKINNLKLKLYKFFVRVCSHKKGTYLLKYINADTYIWYLHPRSVYRRNKNIVLIVPNYTASSKNSQHKTQLTSLHQWTEYLPI